MNHNHRDTPPIDAPRRRLLRAGCAGAVAIAGLRAASASAAAAVAAAGGERASLHGSEFALTIDTVGVNFSGGPRTATAVNGAVPAPALHWREGDTVTIRVTNRLAVPTSIHWHGIVLPADMDGVPGLSFTGIAPGETFVYRFPVRQSGTYWYHSHSGFQEQTGLYGPIVIAPREGERQPSERDYVVMLSDWTDGEPARIFATLKKKSDFFNTSQPTFGDFLADVQAGGVAAALEKRAMWNRMRMVPTDFSDVTASARIPDALTYLVNGMPSAGNWTGLFRAGEKIRLRFINGAATTIFDVRIPGLKMTVVAADGQDVEPVAVDEFRISVAETYDVIVEPQDERAYTIFAQSIGRSGFVRATLAPRAGMQAAVPAVDRAQWLSMVDMMGAMAMPGGHARAPTQHGTMQHDATPPAAGQPAAASGQDAMAHGAMDQATMDHAAMNHGAMDHAAMNQATMDHAAMHHGAADMAPTAPVTDAMQHGTAAPVRHARSEYGVNVDMRVDMPRSNLDDPGVNLRNNGRRVLTYADLRSIGGPLDARLPEREIELHLTGNMERFIWSFDGQTYGEALPIHFRRGERLRVVLVNDTMMNHPIHLHGMWSELEGPDGQFQVRKHTINVQPAQRIAYRVTADAPGRWAYHCHLLYHMEAGMFREVVVS